MSRILSPVSAFTQLLHQPLHVFEDSAFPFFSEFHIQITTFRHEANQRLGFKGIKTIAYKCSGGRWCGIDQCSYSCNKICFCARLVQIGSFYAASGNVKETNQAGRSVTNIFKFHLCALIRQGRFIRIIMLQCLNSRHFIC